jgi:SAM-dependent methyltransferase
MKSSGMNGDDATAIDIDLPMVAAYRRVQGLGPEIDTTIHPDDEMFHYLTQCLGNPEDRSAVSYFETGREILASIDNLLEASGRSLESIGRVLEFASGYGRLTRHLASRVPHGQLAVSDIQPGAMDFASRVFGPQAIVSSSSPEKVALGGPYGLIIVISLFTHLPPRRYVEWLGRLYGALAPDGILAFTLHGHDLLPEADRHPSGFTFRLESENEAIESKNLQLGLAEYGNTFVSWPTAQLLAQVCGIGNLYQCPKDLVDFQDLLVASRDPIPGLESWPRTSLIRGFIDRVEVAGGGNVRVSGWVGDVARPGPVKDLRVQIDGERWEGRVSLGLPRDDVAQVTDRPEWSRSGWYFEGSLEGVKPGRHLITAVADGTCFALDWKDLPT